MRRILIPAAALLLIASATTTAHAFQTEQHEFSGVTRISGDGTSGDVIIKPTDGRQVRIELFQDVTPAENFQGEVKQSGSTVTIRERWSGRNSHGQVRWTVYLPQNGDPTQLIWDTASGDLSAEGVTVNLKFDTASGDLDLSGVTLVDGSRFDTASGDITLTGMTVSDGCEFDTASGDITLDDVTLGEGCDFSTASGDVDLVNVTATTQCEFSTASGDVHATGSRGAFDLSSASGNVRISDCELTGQGDFSSASGDVVVRFGRLPAHDLSVSSASGDVTLQASDFGRNYTLVMVARKDRGRISCPMSFTTEDEFEKNGKTYLRKTVTAGSGGPEIHLSTASGSVIVRR
jgi:DUF4097 and DUF4098 domain-containing protein YvlB